MENYEKKYKEVLEKAKALYKASEPMSGCNVIIETLFPDLAESEDEKIKVAPQNTVKEMEEKLLLQKAVSVYGTIAQTDMAIEEMGELIVAINHYRRGRVEMDAVKEEIADVMIAMKQLAIIYGESGVKIFSEKKMQRLEQRLKDK